MKQYICQLHLNSKLSLIEWTPAGFNSSINFRNYDRIEGFE